MPGRIIRPGDPQPTALPAGIVRVIKQINAIGGELRRIGLATRATQQRTDMLAADMTMLKERMGKLERQQQTIRTTLLEAVAEVAELKKKGAENDVNS